MFSTVCNYLFLPIDKLSRWIWQFCGLCILCLFPFLSFTQRDTTKFEGVTILGNHPKVEEHMSYSRDDINNLAPADLGVLLKRVPGVTIADYGGIGSMKTMSIRGLGSTHSGLLINGYPQTTPQNSQVDFGRIQIDHIESATVQLSPSNNISTPVSSQMQGNFVSIQTFDQSFTSQRFSLRSSSILGSFGRKEVSANLKVANKNSFLSLSGIARDYKGNFDYTLPFDIQDANRTRSNNNMTSYSLSIGGGKKWSSRNKTKHRARVFANINHINRSLPGAIILYNSPSNESLMTETRQVGGDYSLFSKRISLRSFLNITSNNLRYHDPEYFNLDVFIDNQYLNNSYQSGINTKISLDKINILFGNDIRYDNLSSSRNLGKPERFSNITLLGGEIDLKYILINPSIFHHYVNDRNTQNAHSTNYNRWNPQLSITSSDALFKKIQITLWYKHSSRAPSFNELYYSQIGNISLIPEESQQINSGYVWLFNKENISGSISGNIFLNRISNKIVALPTQNLFVWSIQNVGNVFSYGKDLTIKLNFALNDAITIDLSSSITYQSVTDRSSRDSPSFGHQIANTPEWTNASDIQFSLKNFNIGLSSLFMGKRYSLNENIPINVLDSYLTFDATLGYNLKIKQRHSILFQIGVKNFLDSQYYHINYYVMPGRNYFLKLAYEI